VFLDLVLLVLLLGSFTGQVTLFRRDPEAKPV